MELPNLGEHCGLKECNRLDFLPVKCSGCEGVYCGEHFGFASHGCPASRDVRVPVCPLCHAPIPVRNKGDAPDLRVSQHIDSDCQSNPAKERRRVFRERCQVAKCKKKEMIKLHCNDCGLNYCLQHRHPSDHECGKKKSKSRSGTSPGQLAADAAMARALQDSMRREEAKNSQMSQEELDRMMALSLQQQEADARNARGTTRTESGSGNNCAVS